MAWAALVALSLASAFAAAFGGGVAVTLLVGFVAFTKARLILTVYLGLSQVPGWRRGFSFGLGVFMLTLVGLGLIGG